MYSSEKPVSISIMLVSILILSIFVSISGLIAEDSSAELGAPVQIPVQGSWVTYGPWVIQSGDSVQQTSKTIIINGGITVQSGGKLTLSSCKLLINSASRINPLTITVQSGGELIIKNSQLEEYLPTNFSTPDYWALECSGKLTIQKTKIQHLWGGVTTPGNQQFVPGGINCQDTSKVEITNCTIIDPLNTAIYLDNTDAFVGWNEIYGANRSIYCQDGKDVKFIENEIYDSNYALQVLNADDCLVRGNNIHHNHYGIHLENTDITVQNNRVVRHNLTTGPTGFGQAGGDGLVIRNCNGEVSGNILSYNAWQDLDISNGQIDLFNNELINDGRGTNSLVDMRNCDNSRIWNNYLEDTEKMGILIRWSDQLELINNTVKDCWIGIASQTGLSPEIEDNHFEGNEIGLYIDGCDNAVLTNNTFNTLNYTTDLYILHSDPVYSYNNSFDKDKMVIDAWDGSSKIYVYWLIDIYLTDYLDKDMAGFNVSINYGEWTGKTDANGMAEDIWILDFEESVYSVNGTYDYSYQTYNPYTITFWNDTVNHLDQGYFTSGGLHTFVIPVYTPGPPGDWIVNSTESYSHTHLDETFIMPSNNPWVGNLTIKNGGKLVLEDVSLELQSSASKQFNIIVEPGGELVMRNSSTFNKFNSTSAPYGFKIKGNATIYNSWINYTRSGIVVEGSDNTLIDNCRIPQSKDGYGVTTSYASPVITNNTITTNTYGIYLYESATPYIYNNEITNTNVGVYASSKSSGTILYNDIHLNGGNGIQLESSSPLVKNNFLYENGGNGLFVNNSNSYIFANSIYENDFNGIRFNRNTAARAELNTIFDNTEDGIDCIARASDMTFPKIIDNDLYGNANGVDLEAADPFLSGNHIHNNTRGIYVRAGSEPDINEGNVIRNNTHGIYFDGSAGLVNECNISTNKNAGIYLDDSSPTIKNSSIYKNMNRGIYAYSDSDPYIYNNLFEFNDKGIEVYQSEPRIEMNAFDNNNYSIHLTSTSPVVANSTFYRAGDHHFYLSVSYPRSINNTIPAITDIYLSEPLSKFFYAWWVDIKVVNKTSLNPLVNAWVQVLDKSGTKVVDTYTDNKGYIWGLVMDQYSIQDNNNDKDGADWGLAIPEKTDHTPHNFTASYPKYANSSVIKTINKNFVKDHNGPVIIKLDLPSGGGGGGSSSAPNAPAGIKPTSTHDLTPKITWNASTDPDGTAVKYIVSVLDADDAYIYKNIETSQTHFNITTSLSYGNGFNTYTIWITAEDAQNETSNTVEHILAVINTPPVMGDIGDKEVNAGETLSFTLSATDQDTNPTDPLVFGTNAAQLTLNNNSGAVSWSPEEADVGNYTVNFTVSDGNGGWDFEEINIEVKAGIPNLNLPPVAVLGNDFEAVANETVELNGSGSFDPDNDTLTYHWDIEFNNYTISITNPNSAFPSFTPNETGIWKVTLQVEDVNGTFSRLSNNIAELNITVIPNTAPVAVIDEPLNNSVFNMDELIWFNASSSSDVDGQDLTYIWYTNNSLLGGNLSEFGNLRLFNTTELEKGLHTITLVVTDTQGAYSNASVWIEVLGPANQPPKAVIKTPKTDTEFFKSEKITFDAAGSTDPDTTILKYTWESDLDGVLAANSKVFQSTLSEGEHIITLYVSDGEFNISTTANVSIKNRPPLADFVSNAPRNKGETVTFNASSTTDRDGKFDKENMTYKWNFGDGGTGSGIEVTHVYNTAGKYLVTLTVDDGSEFNNTNITSKEIRINTLPVAVAGKDMVGDLGDNIEFDGTGSYDPDEGDTLTYHWDFGDGATFNGDIVGHTYAYPGTYEVTLTVNDTVGEATDSLEVVIKGISEPPFADPGDAFTSHFEEGEALGVTFDGSGSYDPEDDLNNNSKIDGDEIDNLTYSWDFDASVDLDGDGNKMNDNQSTSIRPSFTYETAKTYVVYLTVRNSRGQEHNRSVTIVLNYLPVPSISSESSGLRNIDFQFDAKATYDPDDLEGNKQLTYSWDWGDGTTSSGSTPTVTHKFTAAKTYTVQLNVTDQNGGSAFTSVTVTIGKVSTPSITEPGNGDEVKGIIVISGTAVAPANGIDKLSAVKISFDGTEWITVTDDTGDWTSWSYEYNTKNDTGNLTIQVKAFVGNSVSDIAEITVTVLKEKDDAPADDLTMYFMMIGILVIVLLIGGLVLFLYMRKGKKKPAKASFAMVDTAEAEVDEKPKFRVTSPPAAQKPAAAAAAPKKPAAAPPKKPAAPAKPKAKDQPIRCPKCKEIFIVEDDGTRPLKTKCSNCGARGLIKAEDKEPPKPDKIDIKCPKCTKIFKITGDEKYFECPKCHTKGTLSDPVLEKIRDKLGKKISPVGTALSGMIRGDEPEMETIRCPVCREKFEHDVDESKIECPSCGAKGTL